MRAAADSVNFGPSACMAMLWIAFSYVAAVLWYLSLPILMLRIELRTRCVAPPFLGVTELLFELELSLFVDSWMIIGTLIILDAVMTPPPKRLR